VGLTKKMELLIISIPLFSSFSLLLLGRYIGIKGGKIISINSIIANIFISIISFKDYIEGKISIIKIKEWFELGQIKGGIELLIDKNTVIMNSLISIITTIVIIYSYWYLNQDAHINRFVSKLLLFSVSMYILVSSKNLLFSFLGWELVGIVSYLLINFWSISIQNNKCAIKAIIFNKIGDITYILSLVILSSSLYSYDYNYINQISNLHPEGVSLYTFLSFCFIIAAMAKSAQIILHCWLGDAMAGPTPVSALLHAATMVTAGIIILLRCEEILINSYPIIKNMIYIIGTLTILFAGLSSLNQNDIKKIIAYSTCAQIGFMFFALGLNNSTNSSIYHLVTHGFFKALLFLSAGLIIHSYLLEQDLRKFGNLLFKAPLFYLFFFIGTLSIIGFPTLSGFYSKDLILLHSLEHPIYSYIILILGSLLSSLYSFKILYYTFFNSNYSSLSSFHYISSYRFLIPFIFLLLGSIFLGFLSTNFFSSLEILNLDLEFLIYHNQYTWFIFLPLILPIIAISILTIYYKYFNRFPLTGLSYKLHSIFNRKFLFDPFFNYFFVRPSFISSYHFSFKFLDRGFLEYLGPLALFRLFFILPSKYSLDKQYNSTSLNSNSIDNLSYLFYYFFISVFILILPLILY
jgi:proton-translocating NADH-quinone oxidoreductase chain L